MPVQKRAESLQARKDGGRKDNENGAIQIDRDGMAVPILFDPKKGGLLPFCVEYPKMKAISILESHPVHVLGKLVDSFDHALISSFLKASCSYWLLEINDAAPDEKDLPSITGCTALLEFCLCYAMHQAPSKKH